MRERVGKRKGAVALQGSLLSVTLASLALILPSMLTATSTNTPFVGSARLYIPLFQKRREPVGQTLPLPLAVAVQDGPPSWLVNIAGMGLVILALLASVAWWARKNGKSLKLLFRRRKDA